MYPCIKCQENNWGFENVDGWVIATCQECGYEKEFEAQKKRKN